MDHHQSEQTFVSVIVPLLNEGPTLEALCRRMSSTLKDAGFRFEIIFVDDGSTDDSAKMLRALAKGDPCVRWLRMRANFGKSDLADFNLQGGFTTCASSKLHPRRKHRSFVPRRPPDEFPCSALKIPRYIEKIPCSSKIIPCSVE